MTGEQWFIAVGGIVITALNGTVAFFLKNIHKDFSELVGRVNVLDKGHSERLAVIEWRLDHPDNEGRHR